MSRKNIVTTLLIIGSFTFVILGDFHIVQAGGPTSCNIGCGNLVPTGGSCGSGAVAMVCQDDPQGTGYCQGDPCNNWNCSLCGSAANAGPSDSAPTGDLCGWANHIVGSVTNNGNDWVWQCQENPFGSPVINCSAPKTQPTPVNGTCSATHYNCSLGILGSTAEYSDQYQWWCNGSNGGSDTLCSEAKIVVVVNGVCGSANGGNFSTVPSANICSTGSASAVSGTGPWTWTCSGSDGGAAADCQANPVISAACGTRSIAYQATDTDWSASTSFCVTGSATPTTPAFPEQGGTTTWNCNGLNGGATATCQATRSTVVIAAEEPEEEKEHEDCDGTIGDYVWLDANSDGVQDASENGLSNITLKLKDNRGKEIDKTNTNSKGKYEFNDLCEGTYSVSVSNSDVSSYVQTFDQDGNKNNKTDVHLHGNSDSYKKADFGYNKIRTVPITGSGNVAIALAGLIPLGGLWVYRKKLGLRLNQKIV